MSVKTYVGGDGGAGRWSAAAQVRRILDDVELGEPVSATAFAAAGAALVKEELLPLDRTYVENQLDAAEEYVVEAPGYRGYQPGAGRWHLRQALARLGATVG